MEQTQLRSLGGAIRARRKELGWTQEQLAERVSGLDEYVRQSDISRIERGDITLPRRQRLERIAAALGLPLGELLAMSGWAGADEHFGTDPVERSSERNAADILPEPLELDRALRRTSVLNVTRLGVTIDRFQDLSLSLQQRVHELAQAREALSETRRLRPRQRDTTDELNASA